MLDKLEKEVVCKLTYAVKSCIRDINLDKNSSDICKLEKAEVIMDHPYPNDNYNYILTMKGFVYIYTILRRGLW